MIVRTLSQIRSVLCFWLSHFGDHTTIAEWCRNRPATREEIARALRLSPALSAVAASYVAPLCWFDPRERPFAPRHNGTIFFLNCGGPTFAVTAYHVYRTYLDEKAAASGILCQI